MPARPTSSGRPATRRGDRTRERIREAATELFASRGFAPVTMRAIGAASSLDNSSLYRHFASKSALAREVLRAAMQQLVDDVAVDVRSTPASLEGVVDLAVGTGLHLWDHPNTARLILHWVTSARDAATGFDVSLPIDAADEPSGDLYREVASLLLRAQNAGAIRSIAWPETFVAVVGLIALRPATYRSFLSSQEPERTEDAARLAWEAELRTLLREMLAP